MAKNIYWLKNANQYMVKIKGHYLGSYSTLEDAEQVLNDFKNNMPKIKKFKITVTLTEEQIKKFRLLGGHKWFKNYLLNK